MYSTAKELSFILSVLHGVVNATQYQLFVNNHLGLLWGWDIRQVQRKKSMAFYIIINSKGA